MTWQDMYEQLYAQSSELRELDDDTLAKVTALMPRGPEIRTSGGRFLREEYEEESRRFDWLKALIKYNEKLREQRSVPQQLSTAQPATDQASDDEGFVPASIVLNVLSERFPNFARLSSYLKKRPTIRTRKPSSQRLEIHASGFLMQLAADFESGFEFFNEYQKSIEEQKAEMKRNAKRMPDAK